jgi:hypothetical protein
MNAKYALTIVVLIMAIRIALKGCTCKESYTPGTTAGPPRWKIDPITNLRMLLFSEHSQSLPPVSKKLAVPKSWDDLKHWI